METVGESDVHSMSLRKDMVSKNYVIWNDNRNSISHTRYLTLKEMTSQEVIMLRISKRLIWDVQLSRWGVQELISVYRPLCRINLSLKGIVHPKIEITRHHVAPNLCDFVLTVEPKWWYFEKGWEVGWHKKLNNCITINTIKTSRTGWKDIRVSKWLILFIVLKAFITESRLLNFLFFFKCPYNYFLIKPYISSLCAL